METITQKVQDNKTQGNIDPVAQLVELIQSKAELSNHQLEPGHRSSQACDQATQTHKEWPKYSKW